MKLKRILAGALAAVVSISTVALASLSTASADQESSKVLSLRLFRTGIPELKY